MSSLAVNTITDANGAANTVINGVIPTTNTIVGRNRIINGGMVIDQRNAGASVNTSGQYPVDRFVVSNAVTSWTAQRSTVAPVGFTNSFLYTSVTGGSAGSTDRFIIRHRIEGFNWADLMWGTASAQSVTLSFKVRSSLTGTFSGSLRNSAEDRSYPFSFTINAANTYEDKTITIAGDTTGTWETGNGTAVQLSFDMGSGTSKRTTAGAWVAGDYVGVTSAVSVSATTGATFYITGVQLEKGSTATSFEYRSYGTELQLCQRYYWKTFDGTNYSSGSPLVNAITGSTTRIAIPITQVPMRTTPAVTVYNSAGSSGNLTEFSSASTRAVSGVYPASTIGGGYCDIASLSNPVIWTATYSAEL